jgi:hypothetical protein
VILVFWADAQGRQVTKHATGHAAVEMDSGALVIAEEPNEKDEARTLAIYARGCWTAAELEDDTRETPQP